MNIACDEAAQRAPGRLAVRTAEVPDPGDLLALLPVPDALSWVRKGDGLVGWGTAARITLPAGHDRFAAGEKWLREVFDAADVTDEVNLPGTGPVAFGSFTFDPASDGSVLIVPNVVLGRRDGRSWLTTIGPADEAGSGPGGLPAQGPPAQGLLAQGLPGVPAPLPAPARLTTPTGVRWSDGGLSAPDWERAVATAVDAIGAGTVRKVVLALELHATAAQDIDPRVLLTRLAARYPDCYTFACAGLVGATPELLVRRTGDRVHSLVLAGTTPRGGTAEADDELGAALLASAKDLDEHQYAVRDVRASLAPLCARLDVAPRPVLLRLANVQHLATRVEGVLADDGSGQRSALALAAALHPTPAVCGTPSESALELIRELEGMDRGRYSGPVGWVDAHGNGEWGIALRCGEISGRQARLFAGCGIVAGSQPASELAEAQAKFRPMRQAIEG
ncbi:MAG: isochorismate synthase [Streptosporangiaceae bacterium]